MLQNNIQQRKERSARPHTERPERYRADSKYTKRSPDAVDERRLRTEGVLLTMHFNALRVPSRR